MVLSDDTQAALRVAILSHQTCVHEDPVLCHMLIIAELAMREGRAINDDDEIDAIGHFIADAVLESLVLKGMVEVTGLDENGGFMVGLTEAGWERANNRYSMEDDDGSSSN